MPTAKQTRKDRKRKRVIIPTPQEWAEKQLENAPPRSEEWAREVARIWCLEMSFGDGEHRKGA
jgi:hypothetical protein